MSPMMETRFLRSFNFPLIRSPLRTTSARNSGFETLLRTIVPAFIASWFPRKVPACAPGVHTSSSLLYTTTAIGCEPPIAFEMSTTSGMMSAYWKAKSFPLRPIPHWISSRIRGMPSSFVTLLTVWRNSTGAGMTPPSP